jgi:hypothetical protein
VEERPIASAAGPVDARRVATKTSTQGGCVAGRDRGDSTTDVQGDTRLVAGDTTASIVQVERLLAQGHVSDARPWLAVASSRRALSALLRDVLATDESLEEVAAQSYVHNNGFDKIVLLNRESWALRLHIWWPDQSPVDVEHVHDHAWDFISTIVTGSYQMELYRAGGDDEWFEYRYEFPEGRPELHGLRLVGRTRLTRVLSIHVPTGGSYAIHGGQLHRVAAVSGALTSSLVLQGPVMGDGSTVLSESVIPAVANVPTVPFSASELRSRLMGYIRELESKAGDG